MQQHFVKSLIVSGLMLMLAPAAISQQPSKEELQRKTQELLREIESVKQNLAETQKSKKQNLALLRSIEHKMDIRNQVVRNIKGEVYLVEKDIIRTYRDIDTMKQEIKTLKEQYAQSIVYAYKNRSNYDFLNFLFSSANFGDVMRRLSYLKTYRSFREKKAGDIVQAQTILQQKINSLTGKREEKAKALELEAKQMAELAAEKNERDKVVSQIQSQENELRKTLTAKDAERKKIQNAIAAVIKRERDEALRREREEAAKRKAAEDAARKAAAANNTAAKSNPNTSPATNANTEAAASATTPPIKTNPVPVASKPRERSAFETTPEGLISSQAFEENRGRMPWPVAKGTVTLKFGDNRIPGKTRDIVQYSDGLTIETDRGTPVKAVFDGEVMSVSNIGSSQMVIVKHGKYFTTYVNLTGVSVSRGQKVSAGTVLGAAGQNDDGIGEIDFRVDTEKGAMNPEVWLRRR
ncbi:MAG TPA: peptidoglycan DD-metalloendopeptidase family protein [Phnomibacter sp.]|nr:peptidoglycan DD-metalloendopeptidase family protein [Phnomibacter sp.]